MATVTRSAAAIRLNPPENPAEKAWLSMGIPGDIDSAAEYERLSLDVPKADYDYLEVVAAYRNSLARVQGKKIRRQTRRKSLAQQLLAAKVDELRKQFEPMIAACGPFPAARDAKAMDEYVRRVLAWDKKHNPK